MKRNLKGKLILSIATLGLAAASTIGSTYAWFIVNSDATAKGVEMKANAGTGLYIRNGHTDAFGESADIKSGTNLKWEPVTGYDGNALTAAGEFAGSFGTFSGIDSTEKSKLTYTTVNGKKITDTDVFGKEESGTTAYYYAIEMDYMISTNKKLSILATNVEVNDDNATVKREIASIAQAARVAFFPATAWNDSGSHTWTTVGVQEYCLTSSTTSTDYNLEQLKALGYSDDTEYKFNEGTAVTSKVDRKDLTTTAYEISSHTDKKTNDGSFTYGSVKIFVWFDGTDHACSNALFEQKLTFNFKFSVKDTTTA